MRSISNGKDRQLTVGIDIGSSNICCAIGSIIPDANRVKLLGISSIPSMGFRKGSISHRNQLIEQLEKVLKLLHPFMPFLSEEIWHLIEE